MANVPAATSFFSTLNECHPCIQFTMEIAENNKLLFLAQPCGEIFEADRETNKPVRISLPFKDQKSADAVRKQLKDLRKKIGTELQPVYTSAKIGDKLKLQEEKPALVNNQCVVYSFKCDQCDADYVGYTTRHLHQRIEEHKTSVIGKHIKEIHGVVSPDIRNMFSVLKRCKGKLDCLVNEMLLIRERKPALNTQAGSIRAEVFT
ncbi:hypothetical protein ACROYT_G035211 [Oculina patagonica]